MSPTSETGDLPEDPPPFPPFPVYSSERVYDSPWCGLRRDEVVLPSGNLQEYHVFEVGPAVTVVPVTAEGHVVMIGQYRYPHGKTHWELPAGRLHEDEAPERAARRELWEETGYQGGRAEALPGFYPTNGISAHYAHAFVVHDCEPIDEGEPEEAEQLIVRVFQRREVEQLLDAGKIEDAFAALPLLYWLRRTGGA